MTPHPMTQASEAAAAEVLERIAAHNLADPVTDDLSVQLAIDLAEAQEQNRHLLAQVEELKVALRPFVELSDDRDNRYRLRGGNPDSFPDTHPAYDISATALKVGVWRRARAALKGGQ